MLANTWACHCSRRSRKHALFLQISRRNASEALITKRKVVQGGGGAQAHPKPSTLDHCLHIAETRTCSSQRPVQCHRVLVGRVYGTPSYWVQRLFSENQGSRYLSTGVAFRPEPGQPGQDVAMSASATCQDDSCSRLSLKVSIGQL